MLRRIVTLAIVLGVIGIFIPMIARTIIWATNGPGLINIAAYPDDEHSFNPFSERSSFVSPAKAEWILIHFDWPYSRRVFEVAPLCTDLTNFVISAIDSRYFLNDDEAASARLLRLASVFIERGEPFDTLVCGRSALQSAVINGDVESVQLLLDHGADPRQKVSRDNSPFDGLDSFALADLVNAKFPDKTHGVVEVLARSRNAN